VFVFDKITETAFGKVAVLRVGPVHVDLSDCVRLEWAVLTVVSLVDPDPLVCLSGIWLERVRLRLGRLQRCF
jgi:hypothetical protein